MCPRNSTSKIQFLKFSTPRNEINSTCQFLFVPIFDVNISTCSSKSLVASFVVFLLCNYQKDEHILKTLIQKNVLPTDPTKNVRLTIYKKKFKSSNLIISKNTSPSTELFEKTNILYMFKCPLGDCVSKENNAYVGLTTTTLSRRLTIYLNDSNSIALHLKTNLEKF